MATPPSYQNVLSKQIGSGPDSAYSFPVTYATDQLSKETSITLPQLRRTHPLVWCIALLCLLFSLSVIFFVVATLIIFLVIKPKYPLFDIPSARLNAIYFDSPEYFNGDLCFSVNFSNPNKKMSLRFEYLDLRLYFHDQLIAVQSIETFIQREGQMSVGSVNMVSSLVYLPSNLAEELHKEVESNKVLYDVEGNFKLKMMLGFVHIGYWLKARCQLEMTAPPNGLLMARRCNINR
ncbi:hypothetical protein Droror1_Dr00014299 [Drosera rotundifolia]